MAGSASFSMGALGQSQMNFPGSLTYGSGANTVNNFAGSPSYGQLIPVAPERRAQIYGVPYNGGNTLGATDSYSSGPTQAQVQAQQAAQAAAQAEAQRIAGIRAQATAGQEGLVSGANTGLRGYQDSYRLQNQGIAENFRQGVKGYNTGRENTALNLRRGIAGVTSGVRQGLQGAMTALPDSALDSGATGALARSWNKQGQQQASGVYNEAGLANRQLEDAYGETVRARDMAIGNLGMDRASKVDAISNQLYNDLRAIDANASAQGVTGAVNLGLRDNVINNAIAQLNALDQERGNTLAGINPLTGDQITANAVAMDAAGAQAYNPFTLPAYPGATPVDQAAPVSNIPFYTRRRDEL